MLQTTPRSMVHPQERPSFRFSRVSVLRAVLVVDALPFLTGAALNFGAHIPLGFIILQFPGPARPAGTAEAIIGVTLLVASATLSRAWAWVGFWLSLVGIGFGLSVLI